MYVSIISLWMGAKVWEWLIEIKRETKQQLYVSKFRWRLQLWQESIKVIIEGGENWKRISIPYFRSFCVQKSLVF